MKKPDPNLKWIPKNWTFDDPAVAARFEQHVREQLPWYDVLTATIVHAGAHYIGRGGLVYDIGASTGNFGRAIEPYLTGRWQHHVHYRLFRGNKLVPVSKDQ